MSTQYDVVIIGAGMSGLAAGIRLAMFDKKVVILEKHNISGGLNSYYRRRVPVTKEFINFDVGLHALTNFAKKGEKRKPLTKLLKQLRLPYDALNLKEQTQSQIHFKSANMRFSNDFSLLESEVERVFPSEIDNFNRFVKYVTEYNEVDLSATYIPTREVLKSYFKEELLSEMLLAPLLIYGSAWENDMDFSQFVIMFKSIYLEGFSRPVGGVRTILELLETRYKELGGELRYNSSVQSINTEKNQVKSVTLKKKEEVLSCHRILSSAGMVETHRMIDNEFCGKSDIGQMSFMETIIVSDQKDLLKDFDSTIVFYNDSDKYAYQKSKNLFDNSSAVICFPENYEREREHNHQNIRITYMANYDLWSKLEKPEYKAEKEKVFHSSHKLAQNVIGTDIPVLYQDVFSPTTIKRYTNHLGGAVYGSINKTRDGRVDTDGLYIIGTDQGFLGIVGAMLSGISMANLHTLMD